MGDLHVILACFWSPGDRHLIGVKKGRRLLRGVLLVGQHHRWVNHQQQPFERGGWNDQTGLVETKERKREERESEREREKEKRKERERERKRKTML